MKSLLDPTTFDETRYGFLGVGAIATAIVEGLAPTGRSIVLSPRNAGLATALAVRFPNVSIAPDNATLVDRSDVILVAVRPDDVEAVLEPLSFREDQVVISAAAGRSHATIRDLAAPATACRAIPLPALRTGRGITPVFPPNSKARYLFDAVGTAVEIEDERLFESYSAVTATIAAHIGYLEAIARWLAARGVPKDQAETYVSSLFDNLDLELAAGEPLENLAKHHATPGGINERFAGLLIASGMSDAVWRGLDDVLARLDATSSR